MNSEDNNNNNAAGDATADTAQVFDMEDKEEERVSTHRRTLNRLQSDASENKTHSVPHEKVRTLKRKGSFSERTMEGLKNKTPMDWLETFIPLAKWIKTYDWRNYFAKDAIAGATVGVMIIPQSMSYAKLAGLPVEYGLYSGLVPVYAYALFGSSRQLAVGPVALVSLLLSTGLTDILSERNLDVKSPEYIEIYTKMAIQVAFLVGLMYIAMGILRLGFVTIFLSHTVVSGFTTGASVIIGMSQVKHIVGYDYPKSDVLHKNIENIVDGIEGFNYKTFLMGVCSIFALVGIKWFSGTDKKYKWVAPLGPLFVTAITIIVTWSLSLDENGIPIVKKIPKGLPSITLSDWTPIEDFSKIIVLVISITIVGFMESIAIAKQLAAKHKYDLDSSLELIGLGMANFLGAMFGAYPVTGSFSRSAVNNETGAVSGMSGVVTATLVAIVLLLLTPVFEQLPLAVLAAVIISGVIRLLDYPEAMYLWKVHKFDFVVWMIACFGTMFLGVETGLLIAVGVSLLLVIYQSAYPNTCVLGRLPGSTIYRNIKQYPNAERYEGIVMVRVDAPIFFANTQNVREKLQKYERVAEEELEEAGSDANVKFIIWELSPVPQIDTSALHIISDMNRTYQERGIQLCFSNPTVPVMQRFLTSGLAEEVGRDHIFVTTHDAVHWCLEHMDGEVVITSEEEDVENQKAEEVEEMA